MSVGIEKKTDRRVLLRFNNNSFPQYPRRSVMVVTHEVGTYQVDMITGYGGVGGKQIGFVYFYDPSNKYIGYVGIIKDGTTLPGNVQHSNGVLNIYFHAAELVALLDTLRNERPVFVKYNTDLKWGSVGTSREPVGEQEELAVS